jgi:hypothetical protein
LKVTEKDLIKEYERITRCDYIKVCPENSNKYLSWTPEMSETDEELKLDIKLRKEQIKILEEKVSEKDVKIESLEKKVAESDVEIKALIVAKKTLNERM